MLVVNGSLPLRSGVCGAGPVKQPPLAKRQAPAEHAESQKFKKPLSQFLLHEVFFESHAAD